MLGQPGANVKPVPAAGIEAAVWGDKMGLAIVPFDELEVKLRAIKVDGAVAGGQPVPGRASGRSQPGVPAAKTDGGETRRLQGDIARSPTATPSKLTVLVMTGVTAMARNSAVAIEKSGDWGFLARQVGPELAAADITIISNEIPFVPNCVANNTLNNLLLCSKPEYWENLELSGVDAIGLTGNHMNDFGYDNFRWTLDFYKEKKMPLLRRAARTTKTARAAADPGAERQPAGLPRREQLGAGVLLERATARRSAPGPARTTPARRASTSRRCRRTSQR